MKSAFQHLRARGKELTRHRLFVDWLADESVAPEDKLSFSPMALDFVMGFRDFNKFYVRYEPAKNELEEALNTHAAEDETHSSLLLRDWASLGLDAKLGWAPRDMFWWLTSDATKASRKADFELMELTYRNAEPLLRFLIIESMEAAGHVFFSRTVPIVDALIAAGAPAEDFPYYGRYHFERETGHLQHASESAFFASTLTPEQRAHGIVLIDRVFDIFDRHFTIWHDYARAVHEGRHHFLPRLEATRDIAMRDEVVDDVSKYMQLDYPPNPRGRIAELAQLRQDAVNHLWRTPGYEWMRSAWPGDFRRMTRYFLLQWVVDNWACADYFDFDTTYASPTTPVERGLNRLSRLYASEMKRRYAEWELLGLDEYTGWTASEALRHYWLDERVEDHRRVFADLRKLTFQYPKPLHRYWIMKCFVRFGDTMMHSLGAAMRSANEQNENFITFAGQPERLHPTLEADAEADEAIANLELSPPDDEDYAILREIIAATRAQEAERSKITWAIVREKRFDAFDLRWLLTHPTVIPPAAVRTPARAQLREESHG